MAFGPDNSWLGIEDEEDATTSQAEVRSEYLRAVPHLIGLCRDFGVNLSLEQEMDLATLMRAAESIDRYLDRIKDPTAAHQLAQDVFSFLSLQPGVRLLRPVKLPAELVEHLGLLREVLRRTGTLPSFAKSVQQACEVTLQSRVVQDQREYIRLSLKEGELTGQLMLDVLNVSHAPLGFSEYIIRAAATGNLYDDLIDAQQDHAEGLMAFKPGLPFRILARVELTKGVTWLVVHHPNKKRALEYRAKLSL